MVEDPTDKAVPGASSQDNVGRPLVRRPVSWSIGTSLLLTLGYMGGVFALVQLASFVRPEAEVRSTQTALILYGRIVLLKALWPHIAMTAPLYVLLERTTPIGRTTGARQCVAFMALALLTASIVTLGVLPADIFGIARVNTGTPANTFATILQITAATTAAATATRWLLDRFAPPRP